MKNLKICYLLLAQGALVTVGLTFDYVSTSNTGTNDL